MSDLGRSHWLPPFNDEYEASPRLFFNDDPVSGLPQKTGMSITDSGSV